jgi:hypothetical protein
MAEGVTDVRVVEVVPHMVSTRSASDRPAAVSLHCTKTDGAEDPQQQRLLRLEENMMRVQARLDALEKDNGTKKTGERLDSLGEENVTAPIELDEDEMPTDTQQMDLSQSVWEAPIILGMHPCGAAGRAFTWLLVLLNAILQGSLVFIVARAELHSEQLTAEDVRDFGEWRRNSAHDSRYMDVVSQVSMASKICTNSQAIVQSAGQQNAYDIIIQYLGETEGLRPGPMMAMLAVCVWSLSIFKEVCAILQTLDAMYCLPVGDGHPVTRDGDLLDIVNVTVIAARTYASTSGMPLVIHVSLNRWRSRLRGGSANAS